MQRECAQVTCPVFAVGRMHGFSIKFSETSTTATISVCSTLNPCKRRGKWQVSHHTFAARAVHRTAHQSRRLKAGARIAYALFRPEISGAEERRGIQGGQDRKQDDERGREGRISRLAAAIAFTFRYMRHASRISPHPEECVGRICRDETRSTRRSCLGSGRLGVYRG